MTGVERAGEKGGKWKSTWQVCVEGRGSLCGNSVSFKITNRGACTCSLGSRGMSSASGIFRKTGPSRARPSSVRMPHSLAMWRAVWMLSPVTIRTNMPARVQVATAAGTSSLTGSCIQKKYSKPFKSLKYNTCCKFARYLSPKMTSKRAQLICFPEDDSRQQTQSLHVTYIRTLLILTDDLP